MNRQFLSALTAAWVVIAAASIAVCVWCGLAVLSDRNLLSEQTAELERTQKLAVRTAKLSEARGTDLQALKQAIENELRVAGISTDSTSSVHISAPEPIAATQLTAVKFRVSIQKVQMRRAVRFLELANARLPELVVASILLKPPVGKSQKPPEKWTAEVVLTHTAEAR